jgi:excisionase family DNA binding protein
MARVSTSSNFDKDTSPGKSHAEKQFSGFEKLLDLREAASLLGMHWKTLERRAQSGTVPAFRVFGRWRFRVSILNRWVDKKTCY